MTHLSLPSHGPASVVSERSRLFSFPFTNFCEPVFKLALLSVHVVELGFNLVLDDPSRLVLERVRVGDGSADRGDEFGASVRFRVS